MWFCGVTCRTLSYQNLEFYHEDVRKSDVECESGPQVEPQKVSLPHVGSNSSHSV